MARGAPARARPRSLHDRDPLLLAALATLHAR